jgi:hypothetical protein
MVRANVLPDRPVEVIMAAAALVPEGGHAISAPAALKTSMLASYVAELGPLDTVPESVHGRLEGGVRSIVS